MRISTSKDLEQTKVTSLGKISAVSNWLGESEQGKDEIARLRALHQLMRAAEDCDADALMDVDYSEEILSQTENPGSSSLKRVRAAAIAVKFKSA
jgi:uncharacterized protein YbjQ (UPF0145 family)